jgi:hypothetical protein
LQITFPDTFQISPRDKPDTSGEAAAEKAARKPGPCRKPLPGPEEPEGQKGKAPHPIVMGGAFLLSAIGK